MVAINKMIRVHHSLRIIYQLTTLRNETPFLSPTYDGPLFDLPTLLLRPNYLWHPLNL